jgi:NNP family nitrate/nitrite transporter-like MFS transporter
LLIDIENDLGVSHVAAGSLFFYISIGYFFGVFVAGYVSYRLSHRGTIVISCFFGGLALVLANFSPNILFLRGVLILLGVAGGLYLPSAVASLTHNLVPRDFGKAFSIHEIAPSLGFVISPLLAEFILVWGSWRQVTWPFAAGLIFMGLYLGTRPRCQENRGEPPTFSNIGRIVSRPIFWVMLMLFMLGVGANVGLYAMLPLYLQVEKGMDQTTSNLLLSLSRIAAMFSPFIAGMMSSRFGARPVLIGIILLTGITTIMLGLGSSFWLRASLFLQPVVATAFFTPGYAILAAMVPSSFRSLVISLIFPIAMLLGGGGLPMLIGVFGDAQMFFMGFICTGAVVLLSAGLMFLVDTSDGQFA